jgi:hypothetical protein
MMNFATTPTMKPMTIVQMMRIEKGPPKRAAEIQRKPVP